ncbi:MAG: hypothetical protein AB1894_02955 [Chloroflexota bacterium]
MQVEIKDANSVLLSPEMLEMIKQEVLTRLREEQAREKRAEADRQLRRNVSDDPDRQWR